MTSKNEGLAVGNGFSGSVAFVLAPDGGRCVFVSYHQRVQVFAVATVRMCGRHQTFLRSKVKHCPGFSKSKERFESKHSIKEPSFLGSLSLVYKYNNDDRIILSPLILSILPV